MNAEELLSALADLVAERVAARLGATSQPKHFDREHLPPGASSWRACLEAGRRGELEIVTVGRCKAVAAEEWARFLESRRTRTKASKPIGAAPSQLDRLARLGVDVPRAAGGRR